MRVWITLEFPKYDEMRPINEVGIIDILKAVLPLIEQGYEVLIRITNMPKRIVETGQ